MRWSIRYQLLVPLLTLLLGVAGISVWTAVSSANRAWQQIENQVRNVARTTSEARFPLTQGVLEQMKGLSGAEYILVTADDRRTATLSAKAAELPPGEAVVENWQTLKLGPRLTVGGQTYFCSGLRLPQPRADAGAILYILYPEALWREALWEAIRPSLVLGGFAALASGLLALGVAQRLSRRIGELERRTRLIANGDFNSMPLPRRNDELRDLSRSVNEMAERLAQLQDTVQKTERLRLLGQVGSGLAHQLRNGVTGARLAVQLHARDCNGAADSEALEVAVRQLTLLEANLKRFLDLNSNETPRRQACSLPEQITEAVSLLRPQCRHAHIDLSWEPPEQAFAVVGDPSQLGQLFLNVIGNAVEAAGPGGWVRVRLNPRKDTTILEDARRAFAGVDVEDSGPGPPPGIAGRLFEPFVTGKVDGVGLGLAVARQVAEAHGGRIDWRRQAGATCFRIELPMETGS